MKKISVAVLGTVGLPAVYGGFESLADNLVEHKPTNIDYTVFCSSLSYEEKNRCYKNANLIYINLKANGIQSLFYDVSSLIIAIFKKFDVVILLGVSGAIFLPIFKFFSKSKVICNVDGIEWKRGKWNWIARNFLKLSEYFAVKFSDLIISDNKGIQDYINESYNIHSHMIPYGADESEINSESMLSTFNLKKGEYAFKVCRIEPENNIDLILEAFSKINLKLVLVGNWDASKYGYLLREKYSNFDNLILLDPIYESSYLNALRGSCLVYIHGHSAGGTNPSLVEAMALKLFIISYDVKFNRYTLNDKGLYFKNENQLLNQLESMKSLNIDKEKKNIFDVYKKNYTKEQISLKYIETINEILTI